MIAHAPLPAMHIPATILSGIQFTSATVAQHFEPHGTLAHVAHFPHPGVICQLKLGPGGLQYKRGEKVAVIPFAELIDLFERADPEFARAPIPRDL